MMPSFPTINSSAHPGTVGVLFTLLLSAGVAAADSESITVYRWQGPDGTIEFSDEPRSGADPVVVEQPMIAPSRGLALPENSARPANEKAPGYDLLAILKPVTDTTYRNQQAEEVEVVGKLEPPLRPGHSIFLLVDGHPIGKGSRSTTHTTGRLERGTHTLQLEVRGKDDAPLQQSDRVTIHVHRAAVRAPERGDGS